MINNNIINTTTVNSGAEPSQAIIQDVQINNIGLIDWAYSAYWLNDSINTELNDFPIPQANGKGFLSYYKRERNISINLKIKWDTREEFLVNMDRLREECFQSQSMLYYKRWNTPIRQIRVNCVGFPEEYQHYNINVLDTTIEFIALDPFWYEDSRQSTTIESRTSDFVEEITNKGTDMSKPIVYYVFDTANLTGLELEVWSNKIIIEESITDGDVLIINSEETEVLLNDIEIDYTGTFPEMEKWSNFFEFWFNWTFDVKTLVLNRKNYV